MPTRKVPPAAKKPECEDDEDDEDSDCEDDDNDVNNGNAGSDMDTKMPANPSIKTPSLKSEDSTSRSDDPTSFCVI